MIPARAATLALALAAAGPARAADPPIPYPHPVITEVLFDVPSEALGGDANLDGARNSLGDEFVEIMNPHDRPIDLSGYSVSDSQPIPRYRLEFVFPKGASLPPGQRAVVFNGFRQHETMPGPIGDKRTVASKPNDAFHGALVYSIKNISGSRAWSNDDDYVVLRDPQGAPIDAVLWGAPDLAELGSPLRSQRVENDVAFSYQRLGPWHAMLPHLDIDGRRYSPGDLPTELRPPSAPE